MDLIKCDCGAQLVSKKRTALHDMHGANVLYEYACGTVKHVMELAPGATMSNPKIDLVRGENCCEAMERGEDQSSAPSRR